LNSLSETFYPGSKFVRSSYGAAQGWTSHQNAQFILYRGIVIKVDTSTIKGSGSTIIPPGSLQVKIIDEDVSSRDPNTDINKWAPPFTSFHNISIPEIGEEVWLIREASSIESIVYWMGRVPDTDKLNVSLAREVIANQPPQARYRFNFKVEDIADNITQSDINIYSIPFKPGDVIQQGRTSTYIRHSNDDSKLGVLDLGIKDPLINESLVKSFVVSGHTQSLHLESAVPKQFTNLEKIDNTVTLETGAIVSSTEEETPSSKIVNKADQIYHIADGDNDPQLYRPILGEKQNQWSSLMADTVSGIVDNLELINEGILKSLTGIIQSIDSSIGSLRGLRIETDTRKISFNLGEEAGHIDFDVIDNVRLVNDVAGIEAIELASFGENLQSTRNQLVLLKDLLKDNLSKNQFIN